MDQTNFNYQQPWMQQPTPPQKPSNGWIKWVVIGLIVVGLLIALVYSVANLGKKFGKTINDVSSSVITRADSINNINKAQHYQQLLEQLNTDSSNSELYTSLLELKSGSDSIIQLMNTYLDGFNDSIRNEGTLSLMDRRLAERYFIKTGRATKLKEALLNYRERSISKLPGQEQNNYLSSYLPIDDLPIEMKGFMKEFSKWENLHFNQPAINIRMNIKLLKKQVLDFETEILNRYDNLVEE